MKKEKKLKEAHLEGMEPSKDKRMKISYETAIAPLKHSKDVHVVEKNTVQKTEDSKKTIKRRTGNKLSVEAYKIVLLTEKVITNLHNKESLPNNINIQETLFNEKEIIIPFSQVQPYRQNYITMIEHAKEAAKTVIGYGGNNKFTWIPVFTQITTDKQNKELRVSVNNRLFKLLNDTDKGGRWIDVFEQLKLSSVNTARIHGLLSYQTEYFITIKDFCNTLDLGESYLNSTSHLRNGVLDVAKKEIAEKCSFTFDYNFVEKKDSTKHGRNKFTAIRFTVRRKDAEDAEFEEVTEKQDRWDELVEVLVGVGAFNNKNEIKNNEALLYGLYKVMGFKGLQEKIQAIRREPNAMKPHKTEQAYLIGALKKTAADIKKNIGNIEGI